MYFVAISAFLADSCKIKAPFSYDKISCTQAWSWDAQETETFSEGWTTASDDFSPGVNFPWAYRDWAETEGIPYVGVINVYPAG
ncbi:MAG: hypothetical protein KAG66_04415 [Methylococcales bacterium]|nr:hypothetical protein [Methylococcales bacterium]